MKSIQMEDIYQISNDVVPREIEDVFFLIPVTAEIGDSSDDMYTLNGPGREIWDLIDGSRTVEQIISRLESKFSGTENEIREDVVGLMEELAKRKILKKI